jgi:hypothetical protein
MGNGEKYLKIIIRKFPKEKYLVGDPKSNWSPLDAFYYLVCELYNFHSDAVQYDPKKVHINEEDAAVLYPYFRNFCMKVADGQDGRELACKVWHSHGPQVRKDIPRGLVFLEADYRELADQQM